MTKMAEDAGQAPEAVARMLPANAADLVLLNDGFQTQRIRINGNLVNG